MMKLGYYNFGIENTLGLTPASIYIAVMDFTRGRRESVWRKSSYLIKNFKNKIYIYMTDLFKLLNLFYLKVTET